MSDSSVTAGCGLALATSGVVDGAVDGDAGGRAVGVALAVTGGVWVDVCDGADIGVGLALAVANMGWMLAWGATVNDIAVAAATVRVTAGVKEGSAATSVGTSSAQAARVNAKAANPVSTLAGSQRSRLLCMFWRCIRRR